MASLLIISWSIVGLLDHVDRHCLTNGS